jgi:hypothetical protein
MPEGYTVVNEDDTEQFEHNHGSAQMVYIIYSADVFAASESTLRFMDPTRDNGGTGTAFPEFYVTEEDDGEDGDSEWAYLADESGKKPCFCEDSKGIVWKQMHGDYVSLGEGKGGTFNVTLEPGNLYRTVDHGHLYWEQAERCLHCGGTGDYSNRYRTMLHRKWCGELTWERWLEFASRYCIDLDDDGMPEHYNDTMGSLTEYGHIPAIHVDNSEGWNSGYDDGGVFDSNFYISMADYYVEPESNIELGYN